MPSAPTKPFHTHPHIRFSYPSLLLFSHTLYSAESVFHIHPHVRLSLITSSHPFHHAHKPICSLYPFIHLTTIPPSIPPIYFFSHHLSSFDPLAASLSFPSIHQTHPSPPNHVHGVHCARACMLIVASRRLHQKLGPQTEQKTYIDYGGSTFLKTRCISLRDSRLLQACILV